MQLGHTFMNDTVEGTYEFVGGTAHLIESNGATANPGRQQFPLEF
jgi:hypothetical protein